MYDLQLRERARSMHAQGTSLRQIGLSLGVSRATVRCWIVKRTVTDSPRPTRCWTCAGTDLPVGRRAQYAYLLGQYLGDGHLVTSARVPVLRIACADAYPGIARLVDRAMHELSGNRVCVVQATGCASHVCYWKHWPCLFPQHGPGRKHERPIVLAPWQRALVDADPWPLIRGLIHSDGCRATNRVCTRGTWYAYPRYFFSNESTDILAIMGTALDAVGVAWRFNRPNCISIARRESVELMDAHIGTKA